MYQNMYNNPAPMGNYNPYEQNSGLLKNFFSKPVVIILAAVGGVSALMSIISFFMQIGSFNTTTLPADSLQASIPAHSLYLLLYQYAVLQ